jgi:hypothetical protein
MGGAVSVTSPAEHAASTKGNTRASRIDRRIRIADRAPQCLATPSADRAAAPGRWGHFSHPAGTPGKCASVPRALRMLERAAPSSGGRAEAGRGEPATRDSGEGGAEEGAHAASGWGRAAAPHLRGGRLQDANHKNPIRFSLHRRVFRLSRRPSASRVASQPDGPCYRQAPRPRPAASRQGAWRAPRRTAMTQRTAPYARVSTTRQQEEGQWPRSSPPGEGR